MKKNIFVNVMETHDAIIEDISNNIKDLFLLYNYYTKKYKGDRLNDINLGLFLNEYQQPVAQVFVRNKTGYVRTQLIFNQKGTAIIDNQMLNFKVN